MQAEATEQEWIGVGRMGKGSAQKASGAGWSSEHPSRTVAGGAAGAGLQARCAHVGRGEGGGKGAGERNPEIYGLGGALLHVLASRCAWAQQKGNAWARAAAAV